MGETIRKLRKSRTHKMTVVELARLSGLSKARITEIETGVHVARPDELEKIATALGVAVADLKYRADKYRL